MKCRHCKGAISVTKSTCPLCGKPTVPKGLKIAISTLVAGFFLLAIALSRLDDSSKSPAAAAAGPSLAAPSTEVAKVDTEAEERWQLQFRNDFWEKVKVLPHRWENISFERDTSANTVSGTIWYVQKPSSNYEISSDESTVAKAMLRVLMDRGQKPSEEHLALFVNAERQTKGVTGQMLVACYGMTMYNYITDQLEYDAEHHWYSTC